MRLRRPRTPVTIALAIVVAAALGIAAFVVLADDEEAALPTVLVGEVDGGKALIAIVRSASGVTIYSCGEGENLPTHTGWFFGAPAPDGDGGETIPTLTSAGGLELEGRVYRDSASGTLTLASGDTVSWTAEPARDGAGLYENQDIVAFTGLIVGNDGRMLGQSRISAGVGGTGAGTTTSTSNTSVAVTAPTTAPPTTKPVTVTIPVGTVTRTVPLSPVVSPTKKTIVRDGPTVVFLVHGMSDNITTPSPTAPEKLPACEGPRNTPFFSRCEWGIDFIPGLFNGDARTQMFNLAGQDVTGNRYLAAQEPSNRPLIDENLNITNRDANGCVRDPAAQPTYDAKAAHHFITAGPPTKGKPPSLSVFTTWRDSTRGVVESGKRVANQAYAALKWWEEEYDVTPRVVFIAQSFGGLATRFLLSNPPRADYNTALLNADGIFVCPEDRVKMDYLRDHTTHALTLATPHEGSYMSEWGDPPSQLLRDALADLNQGLDRTVLARVVRALNAGLPTIVPQPPNLIAVAKAEIARLQNMLLMPALRDMRLATMVQFNRGPLSPDRARRTAASPIVGAANTLIPMYVTLGRSPGGAMFDSPLLAEGFEEYKRETPKEQGWVFGTMFLSDVLITELIPNGYGRVDVAPYAGFGAILDRRARLFDLSDETIAVEEFIRESALGVVDDVVPYFQGRFGDGVDAIVDFVNGLDLVVALPNAMVPIHVDREWRISMTGEVEVPMLAFVCGGERIVVDYDPLVRALLQALGTTEDVIDAASGDNVEQVIDVVQQSAAATPELVDGAVDWFKEKIAELEGMPEDCQLPIDAEQLVTEFLSLGNIVNWKVTSVTGTVPAPAWERTDTVARDGVMDADGPVHSASALGFTLGRRPFFFEHDRDDGPAVGGKPTIGSWYRIYDNPVTEQYNHGLQYQNDVGRWVRERILDPDVGPIPQRNSDSTWP